MKYVIAPTGADIMHFGKGHDDNPPGRGSGRYAWGSGGSSSNSTTTKKKATRKYSLNPITRSKQKKEEKKLQKAAQQRLITLEARQKALADKERIVRSGTPVEVSMIKGELTKAERDEILDRFNFESKLSSYTQAEIDAGWKAADQTMKKVGMMTNWGKQAVDIIKVLSSGVYEVNNFGEGKNQDGNKDNNSGGGKKKKK
jgi:hypothetical protein